MQTMYNEISEKDLTDFLIAILNVESEISLIDFKKRVFSLLNL